MLPWGHAAVGYLCYSAWCRYRTDTIPQGAAVVALAIGTQFADLLDKPLAWYLGVLPSGRSLGHSVFVTVVLLFMLDRIAMRYRRRELGLAFALGHLLHLAGDTIYPLVGGDPSQLQFLLWPIVSQSGSETDYSVIEMLIELTFTVGGVIESVLFVVATGLWVSHRVPGLWWWVEVGRSLRRLE